MKLSDHFMLSEFVESDLASRSCIDNTPSDVIIENIKLMATKMEEVRELLGQPILISSGYRCGALNKLVGSKPTSKHLQGLACDFKSPYGNPYAICKTIAKSDIRFDQLLLEFYNPNGGGWVHLGIGGDRMQVLSINEHGTFTGLRV